MNVAVAILMGLAVAQAAPAADVPVCICTMDYRPVCGMDGVTYGNLCGMSCAGAQLNHDGECASCACPKIFDPVCGSDGKTYGNKCMLICAGAALMGTGTCDSLKSTTQAPVPMTAADADIPVCICPFIYLPVCGSDGVTYSNKCSLECNSGVTLVRTGKCPTDETTEASLTLSPFN